MNKHLLRMLVLIGVVLMPVVAVSAQTPGADSGPPMAFAQGIGETATFFDDRGNPIFEVTVTSFERDWEDYDEFSAPERGKYYVKVNMAFTNLTDSAEIVSPHSITLIDNTGLTADPGFFSGTADLMENDVSVDPGETVEGSLVFAVYAESDAMMVIWQPDFYMYVFIYVGE